MSILRDERAQVTVETAIAFPVQIVITLAIMQFCLIHGAKQVVNYAAHAAARAALVGLDAHRAAAIACSPIAGSDCVPGNVAPIYVPGRGNLPRSRQSQLKTAVAILNPPNDGDKKVTVQVTHSYQLIVPFVEYTPFNDWHLLWGAIQRLGPGRVVHKTLTQTLTIPQPWDGDLNSVGGAHEIIPDLSAEESGN
jgi:Flp pilus assembly protein TadG